MTRYTILVVDDNPKNIDVFKVLLEKHFKVKAAISGQKAIELCEKDGDIDIILLDILMPGLDGFEVCQQIKSNPISSHIPVVFISTLDDDASERKGFSLGASDYIPKPVSATLLKARISSNIQLAKFRQYEKEKKERESLKTLEAVANYFVVSGKPDEVACFDIVETMRSIMNTYDANYASDYHMSAIFAALNEFSAAGKTDDSDLSMGLEILQKIPQSALAHRVFRNRNLNLDETANFGKYEKDPEMLGILLLRAAKIMADNKIGADSATIRDFINKYAPLLPLQHKDETGSYPVKTKNLIPGMVLAEALKSAEGCIYVPSGVKVTRTVLNYIMTLRKNSASIQPTVLINKLDFSED